MSAVHECDLTSSLLSCATEDIFNSKPPVLLPFPLRACHVFRVRYCNPGDSGLFGSWQRRVLCRPSESASHSSAETLRDSSTINTTTMEWGLWGARSGAKSQEQGFLVTSPSPSFHFYDEMRCPSPWHMSIQGQDGVAEERTLRT